MRPIYRSPAYFFLSYLQSNNEIHPEENNILDCGAGGPVPPLGLFFEYGFKTHGIDISEDQITLAKQFEKEQAMQLNIQKGDMRAIPFPDVSFDFVFEMYSMVHLSKDDIRTTLSEIQRVLKPNGISFVTFMSTDCWPMDGKEEKPGEFRCIEHGQNVIHSLFSDKEALQYCSNWNILQMVKQSRFSPTEVAQMSPSDWDNFYDNNELEIEHNQWLETYLTRVERWRSVHLFFILQKTDA